MTPSLRAWLSLVVMAHAMALSSPAIAETPNKPAQQHPQDLIAKGQALFEDQRYEESIQTLSAALLRPGNTKAQRVEIYRLLALDYITLGRQDEAESAVRGLLGQQPDYQLPQAESPRFREFFADVRRRWEAEGKPGVEESTERPPARSQATVRHQSPPQVEANKDVAVRAQVVDPGGTTSAVRLYYRAGTKGEFTEAGAGLDERGNVQAQIPASAVRPPIVEYYLVALDPGGGATANRGDETTPLRIAVAEPGKGWVLPAAIVGGVLGAAALVGGLALAGVFKSSSSSGGGGGGRPQATVWISVGEAGLRFR